jgi:hypothetical protein
MGTAVSFSADPALGVNSPLPAALVCRPRGGDINDAVIALRHATFCRVCHAAFCHVSQSTNPFTPAFSKQALLPLKIDPVGQRH